MKVNKATLAFIIVQCVIHCTYSQADSKKLLIDLKTIELDHCIDSLGLENSSKCIGPIQEFLELEGEGRKYAAWKLNKLLKDHTYRRIKPYLREYLSDDFLGKFGLMYEHYENGGIIWELDAFEEETKRRAPVRLLTQDIINADLLKAKLTIDQYIAKRIDSVILNGAFTEIKGIQGPDLKARILHMDFPYNFFTSDEKLKSSYYKVYFEHKNHVMILMLHVNNRNFDRELLENITQQAFTVFKAAKAHSN